MWDGHAGQVDIVCDCIEILPANIQKILSAPYRAGPKALEFEKAVLYSSSSQMIIELTHTEHTGAIVLALKGDRSLRFCLDFGMLNTFTKRYSYPIPLIDECIDSLREEAVFSTLGVKCDYWHVENKKTDRDKSELMSFRGPYSFSFVRLPSIFENTPEPF